MSENNELATQNADIAFQLRAIGQQLELLDVQGFERWGEFDKATE